MTFGIERVLISGVLAGVLFTLLVLLSGCQKAPSNELEAYLETAYPTWGYTENGEYYIHRPEGNSFEVAQQESEENNWNTLSRHYESISSTIDCACALHYVLNVDLSLGVIGESYGWQPSLQVYLDGTWWSMESGEPDYHPIGIAMPNYGCGATRYLYDLTSRETRAPLPDGRYRLVFDFGEIYDACCILEFELAYPRDARAFEPTGMAAAFPETSAWLRENFGDFIRADEDGNFFWQLPSSGVMTRRNAAGELVFQIPETGIPVWQKPVFHEAVGTTEESGMLPMRFSGLETRLGAAPMRIVPAEQDPEKQARREGLGRRFEEEFQYGMTAMFSFENNTGRVLTFDYDDIYDAFQLQVQLEGQWWTLIPFRSLGSQGWWIIEEGENTTGCMIRSPWTGQQLPAGHYRYCISGVEQTTREPILMQAEFDLY